MLILRKTGTDGEEKFQQDCNDGGLLDEMVEAGEAPR